MAMSPQRCRDVAQRRRSDVAQRHHRDVAQRRRRDVAQQRRRDVAQRRRHREVMANPVIVTITRSRRWRCDVLGDVTAMSRGDFATTTSR